MTVFKGVDQSSAFSLGLWLELTPPVLLVFRPSKSDWNYTIDSPGSSADPGLLNNHVSKFLRVICTYRMYMCVLPTGNICPIDSVPLESSDKHTLPNTKAPVRRRTGSCTLKASSSLEGASFHQDPSLWWIRLQVGMRAAFPRIIGA